MAGGSTPGGCSVSQDCINMLWPKEVFSNYVGIKSICSDIVFDPQVKYCVQGFEVLLGGKSLTLATVVSVGLSI